jgi:hypothetical protein
MNLVIISVAIHARSLRRGCCARGSSYSSALMAEDELASAPSSHGWKTPATEQGSPTSGCMRQI